MRGERMDVLDHIVDVLVDKLIERLKARKEELASILVQPSPGADSPVLLPIREVCRKYSLERHVVGRWIQEGRLPVYPLGPRRRRVAVADVERLLMDMKRTG